MTEFYKKTMPRFYVPHCLYHGRACDHDWKFKEMMLADLFYFNFSDFALILAYHLRSLIYMGTACNIIRTTPRSRWKRSQSGVRQVWASCLASITPIGQGKWLSPTVVNIIFTDWYHSKAAGCRRLMGTLSSTRNRQIKLWTRFTQLHLAVILVRRLFGTEFTVL